MKSWYVQLINQIYSLGTYLHMRHENIIKVKKIFLVNYIIQRYLLECQETLEGNTEQTFTTFLSTLLMKLQLEISLWVLSIHCRNFKMFGINRNSIEKIDSMHIVRKIQNRYKIEMLHFTSCIFNSHLKQNIIPLFLYSSYVL